MNRKKLFTVLVAVGIAGMLITAEQNEAFIVPLLIGAGIGFGIAILLEHLDKDNSKNIQYDYHASTYANAIKGRLEDINNNYRTAYANAQNMINILNTTSIFWSRLAEHKVAGYVNYTNWTLCKDKVLYELDKNITSMFFAIWNTYALNDLELQDELLRGMENDYQDEDEHYIVADARFYTNGTLYENKILCKKSATENLDNFALTFDFDFNETYDSDSDFIGKWYILWLKVLKEDASLTIKHDGNIETIGYKDGIVNISDFVNITSLNNHAHIYIVGVKISDYKDIYYSSISNFTYMHYKWTGINYRVENERGHFDYDGVLDDGYYHKLYISVSNASGYSSSFYFAFDSDIWKWMADFFKTARQIRETVEINAYNQWQYYHSKGWYNTSDIPADELPIFPDLYFPNWQTLGNLSLNDTLAIYYSILAQLQNQTLINESLLDSDDFKFSGAGIIANISLKNIDSATWDIIDKHRAYIIPIEKPITLTVGKTYNITNKNTTTKEATLYPSDDIYISQLDGSSNTQDLIVRNLGSNNARTYLKFNVNVPLSSINHATLKIYYYQRSTTSPQGKQMDCYSCNESWNESDNITWTNKPTEITLLDSISTPDIGNWISFNVSDMDSWAFEIRFATEGDSSEYMCYFRSSEYSSNKPYLKVNYTISYTNVYNAILYIFDLDTKLFRILYPQTGYALKIWGLTEDGQNITNKTISPTTLKEFTYEKWGFDLSALQQITPPTVVNPNNDLLDWLEEYKNFVIIACIVLGAILTGGSKKGSGAKTIGILLLIAGIGLIFYWYILPPLYSIADFWDKITFWD
ncbi:MAG: hypothetical protein DRN29_05630 [Thermoplasmata archaeon]|nr:MAG: hypothetical protein DRN29_05630 [Thermoplasmata archaeon]